MTTTPEPPAPTPSATTATTPRAGCASCGQQLVVLDLSEKPDERHDEACITCEVVYREVNGVRDVIGPLAPRLIPLALTRTTETP